MSINYDAIQARNEAVAEADRIQHSPSHGPYARENWISAAIKSQHDIPDLLAVIERVRAEHKPLDIAGITVCGRCADWSEADAESHDWPCPTIEALDGIA